MSVKNKIVHEIKVIFWTTIYFLICLGLLISLKTLLLEEYQIGFYGYSVIFAGALIAAKVVLVLENMPLGSWTKKKPAVLEIVVRSLLYLVGIFIIMVLEKAFETRHEFGGFVAAIKGLSGQADFYHIIINTICVFGILVGFNLWSVIKKHHGEKWLANILSSPIPDREKPIDKPSNQSNN